MSRFWRLTRYSSSRAVPRTPRERPPGRRAECRGPSEARRRARLPPPRTAFPPARAAVAAQGEAGAESGLDVVHVPPRVRPARTGRGRFPAPAPHRYASPIASRTASIVSRAVSLAWSQPSEMIDRTRSGCDSYSAARSRIGACSASTASITLCLQSRHPIPAVRQPSPAQPRVSSSEYTRWNCQTGHLLGVPGIVAPDPRRVRRHRAKLLPHVVRLLAQLDHVAVRLRHLLSVEPRHLRRLGEQGPRLGQDRPAPAFQVAEQPLAVSQGDVLLVLEQRVGGLQRVGVSLLLESAPELAVELRVLLPHLPDGGLGLLLEARLPPVDVVEPPRNLARQLDVRDLVLAHRDQPRPVDQDVRALQHGIAEEAEGREVALAQLLLLVLVARHALQPAERCHHGEQQVQLRVLVHPGLDEQLRVAGVDARREPVDDHVPDVLADDAGFLVVRGQRVPVRHEEEALVLVLEPDPVAQHAVVVARDAVFRWGASRRGRAGAGAGRCLRSRGSPAAGRASGPVRAL